MYKNKFGSKNNISGSHISRIRKEKTQKMSQRMLADKMQLAGIDLDKNAIQRIECGKRFVTDIELETFARVLDVPIEMLLQKNNQ